MRIVIVGGLRFELEWQDTVIDKPTGVPGHDNFGALSYPSVLYDSNDGLYKMWFAGWPHDYIYYGESNNIFGKFHWDYREQAITPGPCDSEVPREPTHRGDLPVCNYRVTRVPPPFPETCAATTVEKLSQMDSFLTADPCVLKVVVDNDGSKRYYMYYTGTSNNGSYNSIFFAESIDGKVWSKKYRAVRRDDNTVGICAPFIQAQSPDQINNARGSYCAGQSSVIQLPDRFYHYFTDTTVPDGESSVRLIRMTGPFDLDGWPPLGVPGLGGTEEYRFSSWDVKYHQPTNRMIAFTADYDAPDFGALRSGLRISVSDQLIDTDPDAALSFGQPVAIPIEDLGVPGSVMNNGGLLGSEVGWILDGETAFYFGFGSDDANSWTIGAIRVQISTV